jgi:hypothetical protein
MKIVFIVLAVALAVFLIILLVKVLKYLITVFVKVSKMVASFVIRHKKPVLITLGSVLSFCLVMGIGTFIFFPMIIVNGQKHIIRKTRTEAIEAIIGEIQTRMIGNIDSGADIDNGIDMEKIRKHCGYRQTIPSFILEFTTDRFSVAISPIIKKIVKIQNEAYYDLDILLLSEFFYAIREKWEETRKEKTQEKLAVYLDQRLAKMETDDYEILELLSYFS